MTTTTLAGPAWLFCPADRPERYAKALAAADTVILDLEDAVAPEAKPAAREALVGPALDPARTIVRVNPRASGQQALDLAALERTAYRRVMVPKAETPEDFAGVEGFEIIALCESPRGIANVELLAAHPGVVALTWGAEDLVAELGGTSSRHANGRYRDVARHARSHLLIAAAAVGKPCADTVFLDIDDEAGLAFAAEDARASGFAAMMCIHPRQVPIIRSAFAPSSKQVDWARGVLAAANTARWGVFTFEGQMVDEPLLRQARRILDYEGTNDAH